MPFTERRVGEAVVLVPKGDIDVRDVPAFAARVDALLADGVRRLVLDLSAVSILPSTAVGFLVYAAARLRDVGGRVLLAHPGRRVRGTLATLGVEPLFAVRDDVEAALREA